MVELARRGPEAELAKLVEEMFKGWGLMDDENGAIVKAVVTVVNINTPLREVTVQGPMGNYVSVSDVDPELLKELKLGEVGILTYAEAVAMSLMKVQN